jgi:hypothetical protein
MRVVSSYVVILALGGCSVINSFDEVKTEATGAGGSAGDGTGGKGGTGAKASGGASGADAGSGGTEPGGADGGGAGGTATGGRGGGTGGGGGAGGAGGAGGQAGDSGGPDAFTPGGPKGALVTWNPTDQSLYVLDPDTGKDLSSEKMELVRSILNDGAADPNDHWYILEGARDNANQAKPVAFHARALNTTTGEWKELGGLTTVPPPAKRPVVLGSGGKSFFAYLTDPNATASSGADANLVVIDVTDPTKPAMVNIPPATRTLPPGNKLGLMGNQSSLNAVIVDANCPVGDAGVAECGVGIAHFVVNASGVAYAPPVRPIGKTAASGNVGFIDDPFRNFNIIGFPPVSVPANPTCNQNSTSTGSIETFSPTQLAQQGSPISIPFEMTQFAGNGVAFDVSCNTVYFTSAIQDVAIFGIYLGTGVADPVLKKCETDAGTSLLFEPYTRTLFRGIGGDMRVFSVNRAPGKPVLTDKVLAQLKSGFTFGASAVRNPRLPLGTCN